MERLLYRPLHPAEKAGLAAAFVGSFLATQSLTRAATAAAVVLFFDLYFNTER
jgi:hypothetical protein